MKIPEGLFQYLAELAKTHNVGFTVNSNGLHIAEHHAEIKENDLDKAASAVIAGLLVQSHDRWKYDEAKKIMRGSK